MQKILRRFQLSNAFFRFAQINVLLSLEMLMRNKEGMQNLQGALISTFIDDETLEQRLKSRYGPAKRDESPIFTRQAALTLLRKCILYCYGNGELTGDDEGSGAFELGKCFLITNDHLVSLKEEKVISEGSKRKTRKHLALQLAPTLELYNPPNPERAVVRSDIMFSDVLRSKQTTAKLRENLPSFRLAAEFRKATGLSLERYRDLVFLTLLLYSLQDRNQMLATPAKFLLNRSSSFKDSSIPQRDIDRYLKTVSIRLAELPALLKKQIMRFPSVESQYNFVSFRKFPLVELERRNLICVDPAFLVEKLGAGVYHTIRDSMLGEENKERASSAFGYLFEDYVERLMHEIYPPTSARLITFPRFEKTGDQAFDGIVICPGGHIIVLEYKGGFLKLETKYSGKVRLFEKELNSKFGAQRGVQQLINGIERLFNKKHANHDRIPELDRIDTRITKVTPVLITQEPFLRFDLMNWILRDSFLKLMKNSKATLLVEIAPIQVIDIDTLEKLKANLIHGDFTLEQCLNRRAFDDPELVSSFEGFLRLNFPEYGRGEDPEHDQRYEKVYDRVRGLVT
ncbi:MAG: hypothetical protein AABN33_00890 [Acidobacteriota bacterium]